MGAKVKDTGKVYNRHIVMSPGCGIVASALKGLAPFYPLASKQSLSGAGAMSVAAYYTAWTTTGAEAGTLADGLVIGQMKKIQMIVDGGDGTLTIAHGETSATIITFADAGDFAILQWNGKTWIIIETGNDADGATAPVVS